MPLVAVLAWFAFGLGIFVFEILVSVLQAYIALGNLMTVCAELRIDACPMEGFIPSKVDEVLHLNERNLRSVLLLPLGHRSEEDPTNGLKKVRKPLEDTVIDLD